MARPWHHEPDQFTSAEVATAARLTPRQFRALEERSLAPEGEGIPGSAGFKLYRCPALKEAAFIGALLSAGLPLVLGAKVAREVVGEINHYDGLPTGFVELIPRGTCDLFPRAVPERDGDYWLHQWLWKRPELYTPGRAKPGDVLVVIVDREFGFTRAGGEQEAWPEFRIRGWREGAIEPQVLNIATEAGFRASGDGFPRAERGPWERALAELKDEYRRALQGAVGMLTINASLAARNAFDAVQARRASKNPAGGGLAAARPGRAHQATLGAAGGPAHGCTGREVVTGKGGEAAHSPKPRGRRNRGKADETQ